MKRILSLTLAVLMLASCAAILTACPTPEPTTTTTTQPAGPVCSNHVDADGDFICDTPGCNTPVKKAGDYTYNTYASDFPTMWNPHRYQTNAQSEPLSYTTLGFYTFDYNEDRTGFVVVPEMAAQMPIDVTAEYVGETWGIDEEETARAWKIVLREDLYWENGDHITAHDFIESAKRLLNPVANNYRADSFYSGNLKVIGAKDYFYQGKSVTQAATAIYSTYSTDLDANLVFTLAAPSEDTDNAEVYMRTSMGFPASYNAAACANYLIGNYLSGSAFTAEAAAAMEGKTLAEIKADATLSAAWDALIGWWQTDPNEELHFFLASATYSEKAWDEVGLKAVSDYEIVVIIEDELSGFYLNYELTGNFGLVHVPTYDKCESIKDGVYDNTYGTSVETFMSYGPYKLTYFEIDKQMVFETNPYWFGYSDVAYAGQYQTTKIDYVWINDPTTAMEAFLAGQLDAKGLDVDYVKDYTGSSRIYYTDGDSTWFVAMNPNEAFFNEWEKTHEGYDKSIMTMKEFRMALSFSLDRQNFINTLDPTGSKGFGLFSTMICSNPELGVMYREEEAAKDALLSFWGISQDDIGPGKLYPTKDEAIDSITGYNLEAAKVLFNNAYDKAVELGIYDGQEKIQICIGTPNNTAKFYVNGVVFLTNCWTDAVKGTKLEGKLEFTNDSTLGSSGFADALRANTVDLLFGVGWTGNALNPYGLIEAYTTENYQYDPSWNTANTMMQFTADDGTVYEASVLDWTYAIGGKTIEVKLVGEDGTLTGDVEDYSCGLNDGKANERIRLLAALEQVVLNQYDMIPTHNDSSAALLGYQVEYGNQEYVYGVGRGGIKYMTYNYTDEEWKAYVAEQGGILTY